MKKNKLILGLIIETILILTAMAEYALSDTKEQKVIIDKLRYDKKDLEITGSLRSNNNGNVLLDFYDSNGYLGNTMLNLSYSDIFSLKISRDPIGILKVDSKIVK